uniref:Uncharacterized protein n=1 Tax=Strongyloides venezuelensis TaxID=75913 RepID=A0A0K0F832_STRVS
MGYLKLSFTWHSIFSKWFSNILKRKQQIKGVELQDTTNEPIKSMNIQQLAKLSGSALLLSSKRTPMIKFNRKGPVLKFIPENFPISLVSSTVTSNSKNDFGQVGKTPRGSGIDESELPFRYRRSLIPEDECNIINNGGIL